MTKRLAIIDGMSVFYRGYYAMPGLSLSDGTPTGGVYGFASIAIEIIKNINPDYIAIAWDIKDTSAKKRTEIYAGYKAGRTKPPEDFYAQLPLLRELLQAFGWPLYELDGYEADDIMGTFSRKAAEDGIHTDLISGDYDMLQLISPSTDVYITGKGGKSLIRFDSEAFKDKYGITVDQFVDYKALVGDSSDNIPGVRKIGPVAAQKLLSTYDSLDGVYSHVDEIKGALRENLVQDKEQAYMSQELARIFTDAPIDLNWHDADIINTDFEAIVEVLKKFELNSLVNRLPKHMVRIIESEHAEISKAMSVQEIDWPEVITVDGPVVVHIKDDRIWLSQNDTTAQSAKISELDSSFWRVLELAKVISFDGKSIYHQLASQGVFIKFAEYHDVNQAAFLIDPLARDRSLDGLMKSDGIGEDPLKEVAAIWQIYKTQLEDFAKNPGIAKIAREFDFPLIYILFKIEHCGIRIDTDLLGKMSRELGEQHSKLEQEMYTLAGYEFNIASPMQLSEVLFTKLQLPTAGIKKGKTGYSTGQKELDKLRGQHPIIELIEQTRELAKLKNTYVDALPKLVDLNSRLHTTFNQDVASTGRLSSTNPNLQNIPIRTDLGKKIRLAFVPEKGKVFISADYSQFELRLAAMLANDEEMVEDFNGDVDIHAKTASEVYGIPINDVTKNQRRDAKAINFGILYGMGPHGLAAATGMSFTESKKFIDKYFELRSPIRTYIDNTLKQAREVGYVETFYGRRRPTPDIHSTNFMVRQAAERAAANMPIQGTEADLMKLAMIEVDKKLGNLGDQVLQIHDSILVEAPAENADKIAEILKTTMENIAPELDIKLKVDISVGKNWGEL